MSNSDEWSQYALGDSSKTYTRNLVDEGNGKSNLVSFDAVGILVLSVTNRLCSLFSYGVLAREVQSMIMPMHTVS